MKLALPSLRMLFSRKAILSKRGSRRAFQTRFLATERLETRALLAADALSPWQNPVIPADVNADGHVTSMDALRIVNELNSNGPRALSGTPISRFSFMAAGESSSNYLDVNGDGYLTASDALTVFNKLNAAQGEKARVRLEITDTNGNPVTSLPLGGQFQLRAFTQDIRETAPGLRGVFAAVVDVTYDPAIVSVSGPIVYGADYPNQHRSEDLIKATPGLLDEIGATGALASLGTGEVLLFTVPFTVNAAGPVNFGINAADLIESEVLVLGENDAVPPAEVELIGDSVTAGAPPTTVNDTATAVEGSINNIIDVLANDTVNPEGEGPLTVVTVTQGTNGTVTIGANGADVRYTPSTNFFGEDTFTYTVEDAEGNQATASVTVTVTGLNDPPQGTDDTFTVEAGATGVELDVLANDSFAPDVGETLRVTAVAATSNGGTLSIRADGQRIIYTPAAGFVGTETFQYLVGDGSGLVDIATVTVNVTSDNPIAQPDTATVTEDSADNVIDVLANDSLAVGVQGELEIIEAAAGNGGTVAIAQDGKTIVYTPAANFAGTETLTYRISDGQGGEATSTVTVTVTNVNDSPTAADDTFTVTQNSESNALNVLVNDSFAPDTGEVLTITAVGQTSNGGTVTIGAESKSLTYTPADGFTGQDTFTYTISDGNGGTATASVVVTVVANQNPEAKDDSFTVGEDAAATEFDVLINDLEFDGDPLTISAVGQTSNGGTVSISGDSKKISYTPAANFNGTETFTYTISDGEGGTDTCTVTVQATAVNDPPPVANDAFTVAEDSVATKLDVLKNDLEMTNPDGNEQLKISAVGAGSQQGKIDIAEDGLSVTYTPRADFSGTETFTYTLRDPGGATTTATVTMTVTAANDAPALGADTFEVQRDSSSNVFNVLVNDSDPDGDTLTITQTGQTTAGGVVTLGPNARSLLYTPPAGFSGTDTFTYTVSDGTSTATQTVTVLVRGFAGSSLSGFVYVDADGDAVMDAAERRLSNVTIRLWGMDVDGKAVDRITTTDAAGAYQFAAVMPGSYVIEQIQPAEYTDGKESLGNSGGTAGHDQFFLALADGTTGTNYNFGEAGLKPQFIGRPNFFFP